MTTERTDVERARAELAETLDAIEYKLNAPKRAAERVQKMRRENPLVLAGVVAGAVTVVAGAVWAVVAFSRR